VFFFLAYFTLYNRLQFQDVVNEGLEDRRTVGQPERHDEGLVVASGCGKGGLPFVPFSDAD